MRGRSLSEDFSVLFDILLFSDFLSSMETIMMNWRVIAKRKMRMMMNSQKKLKKIFFNSCFFKEKYPKLYDGKTEFF